MTDSEDEPDLFTRLNKAVGDVVDLNPFWSDEANTAADANPDGLRPKQLAKKWRKHRIEP